MPVIRLALAGRTRRAPASRCAACNAHLTPHLAKLQNTRDVHYSKAGSAFLAQAVAAKIAAQLPAK